ncbi:teichuronopeptide biosynthesis TupA-like protein [Rhodovulum bhavnagarense]|uniref:Teichuronopeptide biosynthesis TupA-like protein n=1 Tax=Rhodovulum bhavnagarense TaxID=992286 RepID=A0A4R2R9L6_9RHOB|nr:ATP-grasp fold amidoligase family protein [Rhodovulum bhavnagarense]TCP58768.1 teichuronopeptide biosynthesis TupA-like protein [Rhodovulum bhavnagarense]
MSSSVLKRFRHALEARLLPAAVYVKKDFYRRTGRRLDLTNPATFSEKIQYLKLYNRDANLTNLVDKIEVKNFIKNVVGEKYTIPSVAIFSGVDEINLETLPRQCVLKATHGSGWNFFIKSKDEVDLREIRKFFNKWLGKSYYMYSKEWAYNGVRPRIVCEELLLDECGNVPDDYKVFCFNGYPKYVQVDHDRFTFHKRAFFDVKWRKQPFTIGYPLSEKQIVAPICLDEMLKVSETISDIAPFVRVDFLVHEGRPFIGELTFYPGNGMEKFSPEKWDADLGACLDVSGITA